MLHDLNLRHETTTRLEYDCPTCGVPMEVIDRFVLPGAPAPVEHVKVRCLHHHWFTIPTEWLAQAGTEAEAAAISSAGAAGHR